jgi:hypothetical protein
MNPRVFLLDKDDSKKIKKINNLIDVIFPEYSPTDIGVRLVKYDGSSIPIVKIFYIEQEGEPVSFAQVVYRLWRNELILNLDLLGSQCFARRKGFSQKIFSHCRNDFIEEQKKWKLHSVGLVTFIDPSYEPIVKFHKKNGGQFRNDSITEYGDIVVWYPSNEKYVDISSQELIEQMKDFGSIISTF